MTFLKRYGQSAIGLTFLLGAILVQVAMICEGVMEMKKDSKAFLSLNRLVAFYNNCRKEYGGFLSRDFNFS